MHHSLYIHLQKDIVDTPKFWQLGIKLLKHPLEGFWVNITFQLLWVNSKECNCLLMVRVCLVLFESTKLFQSGCTILRSYHQCMSRVPFASHPH